MTPVEINIWLPAAAALGGALIGSLAPIVASIVNARAEARRERLRLAVQLALDDHKHLMDSAHATSKSSGVVVGVPPISAVFAYHADVLKAYSENGQLTAADFVAIRNRNKEVFDTLSGLQDRADDI